MRHYDDPDFRPEEVQRLQEKQLSSEQIFDGKLLHVRRDQIELPDGHRSVREQLVHMGAVCVVPLTDDGYVYVERQYRYPLRQVITELPAGKLDSDDEDILEAAKRELREETGLTAGRWTYLGMLYPAAAYTDEVITMYLAQDLEAGEQELDEGEFLDVAKIPFTQLIDDIMAGKVPDSKTQAAALKAARLLGV